MSNSTIKKIYIFILLFTLLVPGELLARTVQKSYGSAKKCRSSLYASAKKRKYRTNWGKCIKKFQYVIKHHNKTAYVDDSLFFLGRLYGGLYKYSGKGTDLKKSKYYYKELLARFPKSPLSRKVPKSYIKNHRKGNAGKVKKQAKPKGEAGRIKAIRYWSHPYFTRVVIDTSKKVRFRKKTIDQSGKNIEILLYNAKVPKNNKKITIGDGIVKKVAAKQLANNTVLVSLRLDKPATFKVMPFSNPDRIVIDLSKKDVVSSVKGWQSRKSGQRRQDTMPRLAQQLGIGIKKIVIDPGHGGKDPGAIGKSGLKEKDVTLDIAFRLKKLITEKLGIEVLMTRKSDVFIPLERRTVIANAQNADLFISIHVNASRKRRVGGLEVYLLGQSSDKKAMVTAARENSTSEMAMSDLETILNDLLVANKVNESLEFAHITKQALAVKLATHHIKDNGVKRAPFYVLMNANMPSILVETSFISNIKEEKLLKSSKYRQLVATAMLKGVNNYIASLKMPQ